MQIKYVAMLDRPEHPLVYFYDFDKQGIRVLHYKDLSNPKWGVRIAGNRTVDDLEISCQLQGLPIIFDEKEIAKKMMAYELLQ